MKRGGPLKRTTRLSPGTKQLRRAALNRSAENTRAAAARKPPSEIKLPRAAKKYYPPWPAGLRDKVLELAGHCCDMCGQALSAKSWECHHRRLRSQGGLDEVDNLLALHHSCHGQAHGNRAWARARGYIVHRGDEPATRPVLRHGKTWQLPSIDGWTDCAPPADLTSTPKEAA